jgi:plastocyanin
MKTNIRILFPILLIMGLIYHTDTYAVKHIVHAGNYYFNPSTLNVSVGDTVRWQWDNGSHTTTSGVIPAGAAGWDHIINSSNQNFEYKVTAIGLYNYVCTPHAGMGMVGTFTASAPAPTLSITPSTQNVAQNAGTTSFSVTSNSTWNAVSDAIWCTVTPAGNGNGNIAAIYAANSTNSVRVADISISVTGLPVQTVTVVQAASTVGVGENQDQTLRIYPNPSRGLFKITLGNTSMEEKAVSLIDISGRTISTGMINGSDETTFDLSEAPRGYYFVRLKSSAGIIVRRIVITD